VPEVPGLRRQVYAGVDEAGGRATVERDIRVGAHFHPLVAVAPGAPGELEGRLVDEVGLGRHQTPLVGGVQGAGIVDPGLPLPGSERRKDTSPDGSVATTFHANR
jgi:hypothetical protein